MINMRPKKRLLVVLGILIVMMVSMSLLTRLLERSTANYKESKSSGVHYPTMESVNWVTQIESLCILVDQSYEGIHNHTEPIAEELQGILDRIGIKSSIGEGTNCDATLAINLSVKPISEHVSGAGMCYLSASAEGEAQLSSRGHKTLKLKLIKPPPNRSGFGFQWISKCPRTPTEAPLTNTWVIAVAPLLNWWGAPALVSALHSDLPELRGVASNQFDSLGKAGEEAIPFLTEMLSDPDPLVCSAAVQALGDLGTSASSAVPALIEAYQYADQTSQYAYIRALGQIKDARALPLLTAALHEDWYTAYESAQALGMMGEAAAPAVPDLIPLLQSDEHQVVTTAAETLGKIGSPAMQAVPDLIKLLGGTENSYYYWAENALKSITGQELGQSAEAWQKWWDAQ
jgi:hypothetical protein